MLQTGYKRFRKNPLSSNIDLKRLTLRLWLTESALRIVQKRLTEMGYTTKKGNPYTLNAIGNYAKAFIVTRPDEAREMYQEFGEFPDTEIGDREWLWFLVNNAARNRFLRGKDKFIWWAVTKGVYKKAFDFFKTTYHLSDDDYHAFDNILGEDD